MSRNYISKYPIDKRVLPNIIGKQIDFCNYFYHQQTPSEDIFLQDYYITMLSINFVSTIEIILQDGEIVLDEISIFQEIMTAVRCMILIEFNIYVVSISTIIFFFRGTLDVPPSATNSYEILCNKKMCTGFVTVIVGGA